MSVLGRDAILGAQDLPTKDVPVPEWGGTVRIRSLTARDRDALDTAVYQARQDGRLAPANVRARYASACLVGEDGLPLFTEEDIVALGEKNAEAVGRVYDAVLAFNKIAEGDVEALAGN